jgi:4-hydroxybenzoate polyprenyltransferase
LKNWWTFTQERFPLGSYGPMIFLFNGAHSLFAANLMLVEFSLTRAIFAFIMTFSFFYRMRIFDEIKDLEVDLRVNPTRPLARGLLSLRGCKTVLLFLIVGELIIAWGLGKSVFFVHGLAIGYSLLMYEEFFIGDWLRPRLTTYAVTHTLVSVLLGLSCVVAQTPQILESVENNQTVSLILFVFMNWCFFNLFEFARKTFSKSEERPTVDSYSSLFGPWGAAGLSISQAVVGTYFVFALLHDPLLSVYAWSDRIFFLMCAVYCTSAILFALKPSPTLARIFRAISAVYLLTHYGLLVWVFKG